MSDNFEAKQTQGEIKMERYIEDLIRNKEFQKQIKKLSRYQKKDKGSLISPTPKQKAESDFINQELGEIIEEYEKLRKRCNKVFFNKYWQCKETIAENYALDSEQINYAEALLDDEYVDYRQSAKWRAELDMCKTESLYDEDMFPLNPGELLRTTMTRNRKNFEIAKQSLVLNWKNMRKATLIIKPLCLQRLVLLAELGLFLIVLNQQRNA